MYKVKSVFEKEAIEMRKAYTETLMELAETNDKICLLDADLVGSSGVKPFFKAYPERSFDCGIQESNMIGVAAGMSSVGFVPFVHSFGPFASRRVADQIFLSCAYAKLNVKILGSDPGVTAAYNGGTHMPFEDMGILNSIPGMTLIEPTDSVQLKSIVKTIASEYGVHYMRMGRKLACGVFEEGSEFEIGKAAVLREGTDVCLVGSGIMVEVCLKAAEELAKEGISAAVLNTFTWKPMDEEALVKYSKQCGAFVTAENHNVVGGLGSIVASTLAKTAPAPVEMVGIYDTFGEVGTEAFLRERFNLTPAAVVEAAKRAIARK